MSRANPSVEVVDQIAYLTLCAPPHNTLDDRFFATMKELCTHTIEHLPVHGMIVRGEGRHFSAGANVAQLLALMAEADGKRQLDENRQSFEAIAALPYPVIAAISGCCLGVGLELALACHYRIATRRAIFALPEAQHGLLPGCGGTLRLPRLVPPGVALEMILSGQTVSAEDANRFGLVDLLVERGTLLEAARNAIRLLTARRRNHP